MREEVILPWCPSCDAPQWTAVEESSRWGERLHMPWAPCMWAIWGSRLPGLQGLGWGVTARSVSAEPWSETTSPWGPLSAGTAGCLAPGETSLLVDTPEVGRGKSPGDWEEAARWWACWEQRTRASIFLRNYCLFLKIKQAKIVKYLVSVHLFNCFIMIHVCLLVWLTQNPNRSMRCDCLLCLLNLFNHRLVLHLCFSSAANHLQKKLGPLSTDFPTLSVFAKNPLAILFIMFLFPIKLETSYRGLVRLHFKIKLASYCIYQFCMGLSLTVTAWIFSRAIKCFYDLVQMLQS